MFDGNLAGLVHVACARQRVRQPVDNIEQREREWEQFAREAVDSSSLSLPVVRVRLFGGGSGSARLGRRRPSLTAWTTVSRAQRVGVRRRLCSIYAHIHNLYLSRA